MRSDGCLPDDSVVKWSKQGQLPRNRTDAALFHVITIQEQVYQFLKEKICSGEYHPGQKLQELALASELQVSRSPVREALRRLGADGLVEEVPNKGVSVKVYTTKDMDEIYELRLMMENQAIERIPAQQLQAMEGFLRSLVSDMQEAYERQNQQNYIRLDTELHRALVQNCGNALLFQLYDRLDSQIRQFRRFSLENTDRRADSVMEHRRIIDLLLAGDREGAKAENRTHLLLARDQVIACLDRQNAIS